jgi:integrase
MRDYQPADITKLIKHLKPGAYMVARGFFSSLFAFGIKQGWASANPIQGVETRKLGKIVRWPRERVYEDISKIDNPEARLVLETMYASGQRISDVIRARPKDLRDGTLRLFQKKTGNYVAAALGPEITDRLVALEQNPDKPFFKIKASTVWRLVRQMRGDTKYSPHSLRKAASCEAAEGGASEAELQALLGHRTPRAASIYRLEANAGILAASASAKRAMSVQGGVE